MADLDDDRAHDELKRRLAQVLKTYQELFGEAGPIVLRSDLAEVLMHGPPAGPVSTEAPPAATPVHGGNAIDAGEIDPLRKEFPAILTAAPKMLAVFELLLKVAPTDATVLLHGESGTGKELVARAIHDHSRRRSQPYVAENCAAVPESLLESELFGHTRGAFTGADRTRKGRFTTADKGTLFLDEVGDMSPSMQKKLLRALQEGEIRPVGSSTTIHVDVRFLSASNRDLTKLVAQGQFREDLFYRLTPIRIDLPPLRERGEDVVLLARAFARQLAAPGRPPLEFTDAALDAMLRHSWPGNVRELQNEIHRLLALVDPGQPADVGDLSVEVRS